MKKELIEFIRKNNLSPFRKTKTSLKSEDNIFLTKDAKSVHNKVVANISSHFEFNETSNILNFLKFTENSQEIKSRQKFFDEIKSVGKVNKRFLGKLKVPSPDWKPNYDVVVVTEDVDTYSKLKEMKCPAQLIVSETDVVMLESRDVVQLINCAEYSLALEGLPQSVFIKNLDEVYLERHLEKLSGWKENIDILNANIEDLKASEEMKKIVQKLMPLLELINKKESKIIDKESAEKEIEEINKKINEKIKSLTISGDALVQMLSKGFLPEPLKAVVSESIRDSILPKHIIIPSIPVSLDEEELERYIKKQNANEFSSEAERIKSGANEIKQIPGILEELSNEVLYFDFISGISKFMEDKEAFPEISEESNELEIVNSKNIFLERPQGISFNLSEEFKCSILTGANSGGKTTLIEHVIQLISLTQFGLPVSGKLKIPIFTDVYYFAKNKGSMNKGAFETLLTQMSQIKPGKKTLILADEIESVTEPGVAGNIISATADFFIKKNCFLVIATHLGHEIKSVLPEKTRIDGIEAKGLDENFELIVDHNPVLGRLAHSTPELIVEKMANSSRKEYFVYLHEFLKNKKEK